MGVVYRVEHVRIAKLMAMKLLHGALARDKDVVKRFKREAEAVSKLDHPNTVQVFDFGQSEGMIFLVMEYLSGRDLGQMIKDEGPLSFDRAARIAAQVAGSVAQAHERGIIHRDLKPENIMVLEGRGISDYVKVLDFGLAKLREDEMQGEKSITRAGSILGTPYYMAPEHIRGEEVDARSDVYAMGALIYKTITGVPPFWATTPVGVLTMHLTEDLVPPSERPGREDLPEDADRITRRRCRIRGTASRAWSSSGQSSSRTRDGRQGRGPRVLAPPARERPAAADRVGETARDRDARRHRRLRAALAASKPARLGARALDLRERDRRGRLGALRARRAGAAQRGARAERRDRQRELAPGGQSAERVPRPPARRAAQRRGLLRDRRRERRAPHGAHRATAIPNRTRVRGVPMQIRARCSRPTAWIGQPRWSNLIEGMQLRSAQLESGACRPRTSRMLTDPRSRSRRRKPTSAVNDCPAAERIRTGTARGYGLGRR
jgi:tRNA A-37 threonylcarbamoyl transferase component Bud32